jgi:hypothetical protein
MPLCTLARELEYNWKSLLMYSYNAMLAAWQGGTSAATERYGPSVSGAWPEIVLKARR